MSTISYAQAAKGAAVQPTTQSTPTSPPTTAAQAKDEVPTANTSVMAPSVASSDVEGLDLGKNGHPEAEIPLPRQDPEMADDSAPSTTSVADQSIKSSRESDTTVESHQQQDEKAPRSTHRNPRSNEGTDSRKGRKGKKGRNHDKEAQAEQQQQDEKEKEKEKVVLSEAPPPAVNIWKQRQEHRAKHAPVTASAASNATTNGTESRKPHSGQEEGDAHAPNGVKDKSAKKGSEHSRNGEHGQRRSAPRGARGNEKDDKSSDNLPSVEDTSAWPDPKAAASSSDLAGQKSQVKTPTGEREDQKESRQSQPRSWQKIEVPHNVIFNTQFPARGGHRPRGGARGGREAGSTREAQSSTSPTSGPNAPNDKPASVNGTSSTKAGSLNSRDNNASTRPAAQNGAPAAPKRASVDGPASKEQRKPSVSAQAESAREPGADNAAPSSKKAVSHRAPHGDIRLTNGELGPAVPKTAAHERPKPSEAGKDGQNAGSTQQHGTREGRPERGRGGYRNRAGHNGANGQHPQPTPYTQNGQYSASSSFQPRQNSAGPTTPHSAQFPGYGQQTRGRGGQHRWSGSARNNSNGASYAPRPPAQVGDMPIQQPYHPFPFQHPPPNYDGHLQVMKSTIEYYFSVDNLCKDMWLRKHMDTQGFVKLSVVAGFNRLKKAIESVGAVDVGMDLLRAICLASDLVEFVVGDDQVDRLRNREKWREFVLQPADRIEELQHDHLINFTPYPKPSHYYPYAGPPVQHYPVSSPVSMYPPFPGDQVYLPSYTNGGQFDQNGGVPNGHHNHPETQLSAVVPDFLPAHPAPFTLDSLNSISDSAVEGLTILEKPSSASSGAGAAGYISNNAQQVETNGIPSNPEAPNGVTDSSETPNWFKEQAIESAVKRPYNQVKEAALAERKQASVGETSEQMRGLYKFWSQLLLQNFNARLYEEFRLLSLEDAAQDKLSGLRYLLDFLNNLHDDKVHKPWLHTPTIPEVFQLHLAEANQINTKSA